MACMMAAPTASFLRPQCAFRSPPCRPYEPPANSPSLSPEAQPFQPGRIRVEWKPPQKGWFKLNFDGSVYNDGSGRASIGGVIRDYTGRVVAAFAERTEHATVGVVEARALILGLRLALEVDDRFRGGKITKLVVEGDDLVLVKLLRREDEYRRIPQAMEDEIRALLGCFSEYQVQHIYREGNQVADNLCHEAYQQAGGVWTGDFLPPAAREKERGDASRVQHQRICKAKV